MSKFFAIVGLVVILTPLAVMFAILGMLWQAWWLYPAWAWYLVPLGLPVVSFWHFMALILLVRATTIQYTKDEEDPDWSRRLGTALFAPVIAWGMLWWLR